MRALGAARGKTGAVLLSVISHNYDDGLQAAVYTGAVKLVAGPHLSSAARVQKNGAITADIERMDGRIDKQAVLYRNEIEMRDDFRRLADRLKLGDSDREQMFIALQNWVVADRRLDPAMDPKDPEAKHLVN